MRNPCPPSTPRQNELQRRAKAHLTLRPRKGDFKQHKSSLGNCVVSNPILFFFSLSYYFYYSYSFSYPYLATFAPSVPLYIQWERPSLQGATTTPHPPSFLLKTTHYYQPHLNPSTFSPLLSFFYANSLGFLWGFQPISFSLTFIFLIYYLHPLHSYSLLLSSLFSSHSSSSCTHHHFSIFMHHTYPFSFITSF